MYRTLNHAMSRRLLHSLHLWLVRSSIAHAETPPLWLYYATNLQSDKNVDEPSIFGDGPLSRLLDVR